MYVCMSNTVYTYVCMYVYVRIFAMYMYVCMYAYVRVYSMYIVCMYVCTYVCMYVCMKGTFEQHCEMMVSVFLTRWPSSKMTARQFTC